MTDQTREEKRRKRVIRNKVLWNRGLLRPKPLPIKPKAEEDQVTGE